jgi:hypothetical protein
VAYIAKPSVPVFQPAHPLSRGLRCFACIPGAGQVRDIVGGVNGTFNSSNGSETTDPTVSGSPWGPALSCATSAKDTRFAGRGIGSQAIAGLTLFFLAKGNVAGFHEKVISTSTGGNGFYLGRGGSGYCLALDGAVEINASISPPTTAWFAAAATIDLSAPSPFPINFYLYNFEAATFAADSKTTTSTPAGGDGTAMIGPVNGTSSPAIQVAAAGFAMRVWSRADFVFWTTDPFAPARPARPFAALLAATLPPPGGALFRRSLYRRAGSRGVA